MQINYKNIFKELKLNILRFSLNGIYKPIEFQSDFEINLGNAFIKIFPNTNIKYYYWHYGRALIINKNKYSKLEVLVHCQRTAWT
jgi:hypothetical protein